MNSYQHEDSDHNTSWLTNSTASEWVTTENIKEIIINWNNNIKKLQEEMEWMGDDYECDYAEYQRIDNQKWNEWKHLQTQYSIDASILNDINTQLNKNIEFIENWGLIEDSGTEDKFDINQIELKDIRGNIENINKNVLKQFDKNMNMIGIYHGMNDKLREINSFYAKEIQTIEEENRKMRVCKQCTLKYCYNDNINNKVCVYHSGRKKYYSCKGCGGDEYYTCCMKCLKCLVGCHYGKHSS